MIPKATVEVRDLARKALNERIAAGANFRREWLDSPVWEKLASERGLRLPAWWVAPTPSALKRWLRKLRQEQVFAHIYGDRMTPAKLIALNPNVPLRVFVGQMLESTK